LVDSVKCRCPKLIAEIDHLPPPKQGLGMPRGSCQTVSDRYLFPERLLIVNCSMLHDFHKYQNGIRPESVHATYLVYGTRSVDESSDNGDVEMGSSIPEAEADPVPTLTLSLVQEEKLDCRYTPPYTEKSC
jgi:DNA polymerase delta subunit 3